MVGPERKESPFIEQIMAVGDNLKFVSALIVPSFEYLKDWSKKSGITHDSPENLVKTQKVIEIFQQEIDHYNQQFGRVEQIKKFTLLHKEWSVDTGELTPTMKVKRKVTVAKYQAEIDLMYQT